MRTAITGTEAATRCECTAPIVRVDYIGQATEDWGCARCSRKLDKHTVELLKSGAKGLNPIGNRKQRRMRLAQQRRGRR